MKTLLMVDSSLGQARGHLAKRMLEAAAAKTGLTLVESLQDAELVAVAGQSAPADAGLNGKLVYVGDVEQAVREPEAFLARAKAEAETYQAPQAAAPVKADGQKRIVAITACPTGVAHTFMAAEAIESEAKKRGWWVKVETRGSVGAGNAITPEEVAAADLVIVAADIEVDLDKFAGKPMYRTSTGLALKKTAQELDKALAEAEVFQPQQRGSAAPAAKKKEGSGPYRHLLTGVSYMLPMVVAGGLCIALSFVFGIKAFEVKGTLAAALMQIGGGSAFALMVPVLAGFIAFSIADRPGLTPGLIGGMLAVSTGAGFLGGIIAGFLAGYVAKAISGKLRLPQSMEALKPILIIPLVASLITGLIMIYVVGTPVAKIMEGLTHWLQSLGTANAVLLGAILGGMMCTDMGGPVNKAAYAFGVALLSSSVYAPMAAIMAAGMVPPLAMGLATLLARRKFPKSEQEGGKAALVLGLCFITEGAIPFAARDPMRVLPCCIAGGALTGALSMAFGAKLMAPHGGLFVLLIPGAISPVLLYLVAIAAGTLLAGVAYALLKRAEVPVTAAA
ncbi:PTS fructose transporter subunit IIBC [Serratia marcescens]|jgi:PTS system fructose-specific IIC component|uniref:PTS system D-fructose-specific IIB component (F1P-forming) (Frc family) /PTS system D-fructose-specific IIC component (F1P-forming) (Frc family) n=1 Tax=Serratia marcescens TaxID=615 RepID=A0AA46Q945_SERMA|nr:PTS fructose transporter subunit IIBC [Serratia marcescens]MBH3202070.1 PTS fructose transporter subunit IIBC [Serratia marcescens]MBI6124196.1 PTS fructose transporter subunit IIBC [Serratia marcescens]TQI83456.1 PTS system D-fructose-specific IIB component (F1P-forming) (Frc family) /PTS system D-fructose-specific IIC component (F1P-forming) (Frc family) [Serratia marcescens]BEM44165.1 PTS fructose transporter subunit IIBC [Serratia marcescens]BEO81595.1 PTS fructose transporter subunit I